MYKNGTNKAIHAYMSTSNATKSLLYVENSSGSVLNITGDGKSTFGGALLPSANGTHNLGASNAYWKNAYLEDTAINGTLYAGGTLTAAGNLDIAQYLRHTGDTNTQIRFESSQITIGTSGGCQMSFNADEKLYFFTGTSSTLALTLDTSQNAMFSGSVGIVSGSGSGTLTGRLHIGSTTSTDNNSLVFWRGAKPSLNSHQGAILYENGGMSDGEGMTFMSDKGYKFLDDAGTTEWARITSSGYVGIGVASMKTWYSGIAQLALGSNRSTIVANSSYIGVMENAYLNASGAWKKVVSGGASNVWQDNGTIYLRTTATGGNADDTITWNTSAMDPSGNFGIGTASPSRKLTVQGSSGDNLPVRIIGGASTAKSSLEFQDPTTTADYKVTLGSVGDNMFFQAGGSERIRIKSDGNVGIGTTNPAADLEISTVSGGELLVTRSGNSGVTLQQVNGGATTSGSLAIKAGTAISFSTNGTNQGLYINNQTYPRVGIGTSSFRTIGGLNPQLLNIEGVNGQWDSGLTIVSNATGDAEAASVVLGRSGGTTVGSNTIVTDNDVLGRIIFTAADGVDMRATPAEIRSSVDDSSPAADAIAGNLEFYTNDGSGVAPTSRLIIAPDGEIRVAGQTLVDNANTNYKMTFPDNSGIAMGSAYTFANIYGNAGNIYLRANAYPANTGSTSKIYLQTANSSGGMFIYAPVLNLTDYTGSTSEYTEYFGGQVELASYATSYIPTSGSTVTRNADTFTRTGIGDLIGTAGVLYLEVQPIAIISGTQLSISLSDGTLDNRVMFYYSTAGDIVGQVRVGGGTANTVSDSSHTETDFNKIAIIYQDDKIEMVINGGSATTTTGTWTVPSTLNQITFTAGNGSNNPFRGNIRNLQVYKTALTVAQCQSLTS